MNAATVWMKRRSELGRGGEGCGCAAYPCRLGGGFGKRTWTGGWQGGKRFEKTINQALLELRHSRLQEYGMMVGLSVNMHCIRTINELELVFYITLTTVFKIHSVGSLTPTSGSAQRPLQGLFDDVQNGFRATVPPLCLAKACPARQ